MPFPHGADNTTPLNLPKQLRRLLKSTDRGIERLYSTAINSAIIEGSPSRDLLRAKPSPRKRPSRKSLRFDEKLDNSSLAQRHYASGKDASSTLISSRVAYSVSPSPSLSNSASSNLETASDEEPVYTEGRNQRGREHAYRASSAAVRHGETNRTSKGAGKENRRGKGNQLRTKYSSQTHHVAYNVSDNDTGYLPEVESPHATRQKRCTRLNPQEHFSVERQCIDPVEGRRRRHSEKHLDSSRLSSLKSRNTINASQKHVRHAVSLHSTPDLRPRRASARWNSSLVVDTNDESSTHAFTSPRLASAATSPMRILRGEESVNPWSTSLTIDESRASKHDGIVEEEEAQIDMKSRFGKRWSKAFHNLFEAAERSTASTRLNQSSSALRGDGGRQRARGRDTHTSDEPTSAMAPTLLAPADNPVAAPVHSEEEALRELRFAHAEEVKRMLAGKEEALHALRFDHAEEVKRLLAGKEEALRELRFAHAEEVKKLEERWTAELDRERRRIAKAEADLCQSELRLAEREARLRAVEGEREEGKRALAGAEEQCTKYAAELRALQGKERQWGERDQAWGRRLKGLEDRLQEQEEAARATLHQLEVEFAATTGSYQELLLEATGRMEYLEKIHRKYRALKEAHAKLSETKEETISEGERRLREMESQRTLLREENKALKEQLRSTEKDMQELSETHKVSVEEMRRQSELQKASASDQTRLLQNQVETAQHTIQLLRTQIESLQREVTEEQGHSQEIAMRMAEKELKLQQERQEQQKSAATYKVNSEETIAALKRQLREKDTQLRVLAANQAEPLQRLRAQLEDERGKRAQLEAQFTQYKRKAKEAEEIALCEIRKEKLRASGLAASSSSPPAASSSATATPLKLSVNKTPQGQKKQPKSKAPAPSVCPKVFQNHRYYHHEDQHRLHSVESNITTARSDSLHEGRGQQTGAVDMSYSEGAARSLPSGVSSSREVEEGTSPPQVQVTRIDSAGETNMNLPPEKFERQPLHRKDAKNFISPEQGKAETTSGRVVEVEDLQARKLNSSLPPLPPYAFEEAVKSPLTDSISCISNTSPCNSTSQLDFPGDPRLLEMLQEGRSEKVEREEGEVSTKCPPSVSSMESNVRGGAQPAWYHFSSKYQDASVYQQGDLVKKAVEEVPSENGTLIKIDMRGEERNDPVNYPVRDHERRMQEFHSSAAEIFKKITSSREEFLAQCTSIVRQSAAKRRISNNGVNELTADSSLKREHIILKEGSSPPLS